MDNPSTPSRSMISSAVASTTSRVILPSRFPSAPETVLSVGGVITIAPSLMVKAVGHRVTRADLRH